MKKRHAFTLVELLVVIAIIAVLLAVLMPGLTSAKALAKRLQCAKKLSGIGRAYNMYVEQYSGSLPTLEKHGSSTIPSIESTYLLTTSVDRSYVMLGCLVGTGFIDNGQTLFCPAVEGWKGEIIGNNSGTYLGAISSKTGKFADISDTTPSQGWKANTGAYCYWPLSKTMIKDAAALSKLPSGAQPRYKVGFPYSAAKMNELIMTRPIVSDNKFHSTKMSGWLTDCLYPDGHVTYQKQPKTQGVNGYGKEGEWGMYSGDENCQFPKDLISNTAPTMVTDPEEMNTNLKQFVPCAEYAYGLEQ